MDSPQQKEETEKNNPPGFKSIQKFDSDGNFITKWGSGGTDDGQFWLLHDIAIDSSDNVYVVDSGNVHEKKDICATQLVYFRPIGSCIIIKQIVWCSFQLR